MPLILRAEKGSALTYEEMDGNFEYSVISQNISYSNSVSGLSANNVQVAIDTLAESANTGIVEAAPPGSVIFTVRSTAPTGWIKANGAAVSRTLYANLWNVLGNPNTGDGSTTFNLPDLRGEFLRAWDDGRGLDSGRSMHSVQGQDWKSFSIQNRSAGFIHSAYMNKFLGYHENTNLFTGEWNAVNNQATSNNLWWDGSEIRPRNYALLACIKY